MRGTEGWDLVRKSLRKRVRESAAYVDVLCTSWLDQGVKEEGVCLRWCQLRLGTRF